METTDQPGPRAKVDECNQNEFEIRDFGDNLNGDL